MQDRSRLLAFLFLIAATLFVLSLYGAAWLSEDGFRGLPFGLTAIFVMVHLPAAGAGIWLWRQGALGRMGYMVRAMTVYFCCAVAFAMGGNYLWASLVNGLYSGGM